MIESDPLVRVCSLLNEHSVEYLVIGGHACILHGLVRTTEDVDVLVRDNDDNFGRVIAALSELEDHAAAELSLEDFHKNVVIKVVDEVVVDVSRSAWKVTFDEAKEWAMDTDIDGTRIPYVDLETLIATKETWREQDIADVSRLRRILESSAIGEVDYDERGRSLKVRFREGKTYRYFKVPKKTYDELIAAESAGRYWNGIKHKYRYEELS